MKGVVFFLVIILFPHSIPSSAKQFNGLTIDLIHRDSPLSPFYNSSMTQSEVLQNAAMRSISRNNHFHMITADHGSKAHETVIITNDGDYLMKIFIGTPPVESLASIDTGSDLIWIQCLPCQCYEQSALIFDPGRSSTYEEISCKSDSCSLWDKHACGDRDKCRYFITYGDQSFSEGDLAKDIISFGHPTSTSPKSIFGCGHKNYGLFERTSTGIVGLGSGPLSLISQLGDVIGHIFSYCLLPYTVNYTSKLKIGGSSTMPGNQVTTPFVAKYGSYCVTLDGISINEDVITSQSLEIIVDSGTSLTFLKPSLYYRVEAAVAKGIDNSALRVPPKPFKLCYRLNDIDDYPDVTVHFAGATIYLTDDNVFWKVGDYITCLAMVPTNGTSIFGNRAQIHFKVEYDLLRKTVSFAPADCTKA